MLLKRDGVWRVESGRGCVDAIDLHCKCWKEILVMMMEMRAMMTAMLEYSTHSSVVFN